jgi:ankyrin repeat protein
MRRNSGLVSALLTRGADPNVQSGEGLTPLQIAIGNRSSEIVAELLRAHANVNLARDSGETALMTAARTGQLDVMQELISRGANVNAYENRFHQTALMWSAGHPDQVALLIKSRADVQARTKTWDIVNTVYKDTRREPNAPWGDDGTFESKQGGQTALLFAVQKDDIGSVKALLEAGANVNDSAADGSTPLLRALLKWDQNNRLQIPDGSFDCGPGELLMPFKANFQIANVLLDRGAIVTTTDSVGYTPLHGAVLALVPPPRSCHDDQPDVAVRFTPAEIQAGVALIGRMLALNADPNASTRSPLPGPIGNVHFDTDRLGSTPVHLAAATGNVALMTLLLEHGGDPNRLRADGYSPLAIATRMNDLPLVQVLVVHGGDMQRTYSPIDPIPDSADPSIKQVHSSPRDRESLLHIAAAGGAYNTVRFLVEHGVPVSQKNSRGETALQLADIQEIRKYIDAKSAADVLATERGVETDRNKIRRDSRTSDAIKGLMATKSMAILGGKNDSDGAAGS